MTSAGERPRLVLVGGGHAHLQVLRGFGLERPPADLTLVVDQPRAVYSGMVPGMVAGQYRQAELEIDVAPLARRAGARLILGRATGLEPGERRLRLEGEPDLPYDLISWNIGSTIAGGDLPGIRELALPTRPIGLFVRRLEDTLTRWQQEESPDPPRVVVVGGGAGGVELAFSLQHRLREMAPVVTLVHDGGHLLPGFSYDMRRRVGEAAARRGVQVLLGQRASGAFRTPQGGRELRFEKASPLPFDLLAWVTGAASLPHFRDAGMKVDKQGFLLVRPTLQSLDFDEIFAAGDCNALVEAPGTPKAGVFAVREGPILLENLRAALAGRALAAYKPQRHFLALLNLGDGNAIGGKWGLAFEGPWVMALKRHIDRKFVRALKVPGDEGSCPS